jgi:phosphatidate cytidylyltransferase
LHKPQVKIPKALVPRLITAAVLVPAVGAIIWWVDQPVIYGLLCIVCFGLLFEWAAVAQIRTNIVKLFYAGIGTSMAIVIPLLGDAAIFVTSICAVCAIVPAFVAVVLFRKVQGFLTNSVVVAVLGWVICVGAMVCCGFLRGGGFALLSLLVVVWLVDTGAYFAGTYLGSHKLNSSLSPNKTWEGLIGGMVLGFVACLVLDKFVGWFPLPDYWAWLIVAFLAVIGDLFESALKRVANMKDSGDLLPGHGGLLDRLDSALLAAPCVFLLLA